jgi:hypothetical protein
LTFSNEKLSKEMLSPKVIILIERRSENKNTSASKKQQLLTQQVFLTRPKRRNLSQHLACFFGRLSVRRKAGHKDTAACRTAVLNRTLHGG